MERGRKEEASRKGSETQAGHLHMSERKQPAPELALKKLSPGQRLVS